MNKWQKFRHYASLYFRFELLEGLKNIRRRIWNKRLKLWWYQFFVRKNEFHPSLRIDLEAVMVMDPKELERYYYDLIRRRAIAHSRALAKEDD